MAAIDKHFGHPGAPAQGGLPGGNHPVVAFWPRSAIPAMTGANINVDGGSDFT